MTTRKPPSPWDATITLGLPSATPETFLMVRTLMELAYSRGRADAYAEMARATARVGTSPSQASALMEPPLCG